ncbi:MAG: hypothetical protein ACKODM_08120, partial [Cytophagales bacterium]
MHRLLPILLLTLFALPILAQQSSKGFAQGKSQQAITKADSILNKISTDSLSVKAKKKLARLEAKRKKAEQKLDKLNPKRKAAMLQSQAQQRMDSLNPMNRASALANKATHVVDSLNPQRQMARYQHKLDSVQGKLTAKIDSLKKLQLPDLKLAKSLDSLKAKIDSLKNKGIAKDLQSAEKKLTEMKTKANRKIGNLQKGMNEKLHMFNKEGANLGKVGLPGANANLPTSNIGNLGSVSSKLNVPQLNTKLPNTQLPNPSIINAPSTQLPNPLMPNAQLPNTQSTQLPNSQISSPNLKDIG